MRVVRGLVGVAAVMLAVGVIARADDVMTPPSGGGTDQTVTPAPLEPGTGDNTTPGEGPAPAEATGEETSAATSTSTPALMWSLDHIGIGKPIESVGINIYGYIEGGYLTDLTSQIKNTPKTAPLDNVLFAGTYKNELILDQANLTVERVIDATKGNFDVGFRVEGLFGHDAFYTHSNGILDQDNKAATAAGVPGPSDQPDLLQAYVTIALPVGNGITLKVGKFVDLLGVEHVNPTENLFYTHSYAFSFGSPFTETGIVGSYALAGDNTSNDTTTISAAVTRGWNQSTDSYNGAGDMIFMLAHTTGDLSLKFNMLVGEDGNPLTATHDYRDWWIVTEGVIGYNISDDLTVTFDVLFGDIANIAQWTSVSGYLQYKLDKYVALNARAEWYYDKRGVTTGVGGLDVDYTSLTGGVAVTPLPDSPMFSSLTIRPEIRIDFATEAVIDLAHRNDITAAIDAYWKF